MSIRHVDDVMRVMQRPHDDGAQRLCFRFLQQPCVEVMIDTHDRVGEIVGDSVVHTHKTRKAPPEFAAAFVTADTHADLNCVVKHTLEVSKVSFVPIDAAVEATGMESGGMSPIGLPDDWSLLVDQHVLSIPKLYLGSGIRPSKLVVDGSIFADIPGVRFVPRSGQAPAVRRRAAAGESHIGRECELVVPSIVYTAQYVRKTRSNTPRGAAGTGQ